MEYPAQPESEFSMQLLYYCTLLLWWLQEETFDLLWIGCFWHVWNGSGKVGFGWFVVLQTVQN